MNKKAYPHNDHGTFADTPHDISKWMKSMHEVYAESPLTGWPKAFNKVTSGWDDMEKIDFKNWMVFYQEGSHNKYKTAQFLPSTYVENGGTFLPVDSLKAKLPTRPDMTSFTVSNEVSDNQEKQSQQALVERKIQSLIGRLNSAERIATNPHVQMALKKSLHMSVDEWVSLLQKLKREVQLAPMRFTTSSLIEDIIYKNANQIYAAGNKPAASMLIKFAQMTPGPVTPAGVAPMTPADAPMGMQPVAPADPSAVAPGAAPNGDMAGTPDDKDAIAEFLDNLNNADISKIEDDGLEEDDNEAAITVTAQAAPGAEDLPLAPNPAPTPDPIPKPAQQPRMAPPPSPGMAPARPGSPGPAAPAAHIEVSEDEGTSSLGKGDPFDRALSNVQIKDIVTRLEAVASMFKNRPIARQLSIIDLMLDKKGIATFFPTLAEAMRSALESNQYCQSRVEEILAKLRGTMETPMSQHLEEQVSGNDVGDDQVKSQLSQQEEAERARKERRKMIQEKEEAEALAPPAPSPGQELAGPAQVQTAPAVRPVG